MGEYSKSWVEKRDILLNTKVGRNKNLDIDDWKTEEPDSTCFDTVKIKLKARNCEYIECLLNQTQCLK